MHTCYGDIGFENAELVKVIRPLINPRILLRRNSQDLTETYLHHRLLFKNSSHAFRSKLLGHQGRQGGQRGKVIIKVSRQED